MKQRRVSLRRVNVLDLIRKAWQGHHGQGSVGASGYSSSEKRSRMEKPLP